LVTRVQIENYKSIRKLDVDLGRMNVFIGENGCGKTNILEAIALGSAAANDKLDNEFLAPRGIRVTAPQFMRSAFAAEQLDIVVRFRQVTGDAAFRLLFAENDGVPVWVNQNPFGSTDDELRAASERLKFRLPDQQEFQVPPELLGVVVGILTKEAGDNRSQLLEILGPPKSVPDFLVYAPENTALRRFEEEGQILPLGVKGEGLLSHLQWLASAPGAPAIVEINEQLGLLDWFEALQVPGKDAAGRALRIRDRYLPEGVVFDQRSANEGFLFLLFYFTVFASPQTPRFFAVDNVDASLNPKMCKAMMQAMVAVAKKHDKQAIVTTHNAALLDGLDLNDPEQRLFVVSRDDEGCTRVRGVQAPRPLDGEAPARMSEAFLRGYIGGLPKNF
jgi:predicted ATPase